MKSDFYKDLDGYATTFDWANEIKANLGHGILLLEGTHATIVENRICGNEKGGIALGGRNSG